MSVIDRDYSCKVLSREKSNSSSSERKQRKSTQKLHFFTTMFFYNYLASYLASDTIISTIMNVHS